MAGRVLFIGAGDVGLKMADGLLAQAQLDHLTLSDWNATLAPRAAMLGACHGARVSFEQIDGRDKAALAALIRKAAPDLILQCASLISPWSIIGRDHPVARKISAAGIALQIPAQLPILLNVMEVVRDLGIDIPVANITMPDILHPVLATRGLAPTIGVGNVSMHHLRVRHRLVESGDARAGDLIRVIGHHCQVYEVMKSAPPIAPKDHVQVFLGEEGNRQDALAYEGTPFAPGQIYNDLTAASAVPVLKALLPGAAPLRFSAPSPLGLPGGYPVRIENGTVSLDLPPGITQADAVAWNQRQGARDGVALIGNDGTVHFTDNVKEAVADLDPSLAEPVSPDELANRTGRFLELVRSMG